MYGAAVRVRTLYMHNDYMPIRGVQRDVYIYIIQYRHIDSGRKRSKIVGDGTITGIDEQPGQRNWFSTCDRSG